MTTCPSVTWPSPPSATLEPRRTERMVVPWNCSIVEFPETIRCGLSAAISSRCAGRRNEGHQHADYDYSADDHRPGGQIRDNGNKQARGVAQGTDGVRLGESQVPRIERSERRDDQRGEDEE